MAALNGWDPVSIHAELQRVLDSTEFTNSERLRRFLTYIVEAAIEGRATELKEYSIGRDVYDRGEKYDPKSDSIVRVESIRLRSKLAQFYETHPAPNLRIALPKGTYAPAFVAAASLPPQPPVEPPKPRWRKSWALAAGAIAAIVCLAVYFVPAHKHGLAISFQLSAAPGSPQTVRTLADSLNGSIRRTIQSVPGLVIESARPDMLLSGSLQDLDRRFRLTLRLEESGGAARIVWSQSFEAPDDRPLEFETQTLQALENLFRARFAGATAAQLLESPSYSPEAMRLYAMGKQEWMTQGKSGVAASIEAYRKALALEPRYAEAYAGLAESELLLGYLEDAPASRSRKAAEAARSAIAINPRLATPHAILGNIAYRIDWDFAKAEHDLRMALDLQPDYPPYVFWFALTEAVLGRGFDGLPVIQTGKLTNPRGDIIGLALATILYSIGDFGAAERELNEGLANNPGQPMLLDFRGQVRLALDRRNEAESDFAACDAAGQHRTWPCIASLGHLRGLQGDRKGAAAAMALLDESGLPLHFGRALIFVGLGDSDSAENEIRKAFQVRDTSLAEFLIDRRFQKMRDRAAVARLMAAIKK